MTLIGALEQIVEQKPPSQATIDENGLRVPRRWSVIARSELHAYNVLKDQWGIRRGSVFKDFDGSVPDPSCLLQTLTIVGKPAAVSSGYGQYLIDGQYSSITAAPQPVPGGPVVWSVGGSLVSKVVDHDFDGNPITNAADEPFDPPLTKLSQDVTLHASFYAQADNILEVWKMFSPFNGTLNDDTWMGEPAGSWLCSVFRPTPSDIGYYKVDVDFQLRKQKTFFDVDFEGWEDAVPNRGRRIKKADGSYAHIMIKAVRPSVNGDDVETGEYVPAQEPMALNEDGTGISDDQENPSIIGFTHYDHTNFKSIPGLENEDV